MIRRLSIYIAIVILSAVFWTAVGAWINDPLNYQNISSWLTPSIVLVVLSALVGLSFIALPSKLSRLFVSLLLGATFVAIFGFNMLNLAAVAIILVSHLAAMRRVTTESSERHKINGWVILRRSLATVIFPIMIAISFAYYQTPAVQSSASRSELPTSLKRQAEKGVELFLKKELSVVPEAQREQLKSQVIDDAWAKINQSLAPYSKFLPPIIAFGLYLILQGVSIVFILLGSGFGALLFVLLKKFGFFKVEEYQVTAERIVVG